MPDIKKTSKETQGSKGAPRARPPEESIWEWVVAALGALLVVSTLGFLLYDSFLGASPPDISVEMTNIQMSGDRYLVQFQATNTGGEGATNVTIQGELRDTNGKVETANTTISYIASGSRRSGGLYFSQDPRTLELELRALGYQEP